MADQTAIEWCDSTFNPWIGCTRVSPGCDDCYAARSTPARTLGVPWGPDQPRRRTAEHNWRRVLTWQKQAADFALRQGRRRRVFCASLADAFDNEVPTSWRVDLLRLIEATPDLDWLLLTKRIGNVERLLDEAAQLMPEVLCWPLPNVWLGATVVNQEEADRDVPKLLRVPAGVRFLSIEPMLGPVDLTRILLRAADHPERGQPPVTFNALRGWYGGAGDPARLNWVICGGESGSKARPIQAAWAQSLRDQCAAAGVPFLFKQWGEWLGAKQDGAHDHEPLELNASDEPLRVGKKAAGRLLDGRTHDEWPQVHLS